MGGIEAIGVQQYMFRDHFKSEEEAAHTLKRIREIGFDSIELCEVLIDPDKSNKGTPLEIKQAYDWPRLLAQADLKVCALHATLEDLLQNTASMVEKANWLNTRYLVAAVSLETDFSRSGSVTKLIKSLNELGGTLKKSELTLLYHNHNLEYERASGEQETGMERIFSEIDPECVKLEIDAFWMQNAGANPVAWCKKAKGKMEFLHINDCGVASSVPGDAIRAAVGTELGRGNMEWRDIFDTARESGCNTLILETHDNWIKGDPFASSEISYGYIKDYLES